MDALGGAAMSPPPPLPLLALLLLPPAIPMNGPLPEIWIVPPLTPPSMFTSPSSSILQMEVSSPTPGLSFSPKLLCKRRIRLHFTQSHVRFNDHAVSKALSLCGLL